MNQPVPLLNTGILFAPPPTADALNVIEFASVTNALAPAPAVAAEGSALTVTGVVVTLVVTIVEFALDISNVLAESDILANSAFAKKPPVANMISGTLPFSPVARTREPPMPFA
jgi:hypothetical protein